MIGRVLPIPPIGNDVLSISVGVSVFPLDAEDAPELLLLADEALYPGKVTAFAGALYSPCGIHAAEVDLAFVRWNSEGPRGKGAREVAVGDGSTLEGMAAKTDGRASRQRIKLRDFGERD